MKRVMITWLSTAVGLTALYFVVPNTPESKLVIYNGVGLLSLIMLAVGVHLNRARPRGPWIWFGVGLTSFLVADVLYYILELTNPEGPPFPSVADFFYLMMYPLMMVGLTRMMRAVTPGRHTASLLDAAVVAISMFGAYWVLFVDTVWETDSGSTAALITTLAYPVMDVALLAVAARLVVTLHIKHPPFAFILAAIGSLAIADTFYSIYNANGTFHTGLFIDAFWLGFYVLFASAALHPKVGIPPSVPATEAKLTGRQLLLMFVATLGVPLVDLAFGTPADRLVTIVASAMLFLLILVRVFGLMKAVERGQDRLKHDAEHDSLTGLSNRVLFAQRTEEALQRSRDGHVVVMFIDLDDFKTVNDSLGHQAGDELLAEVGRRLAECVKEDDTIARLGGDEFGVLLDSATDRRDARIVAGRVLESLESPIAVGDRTVNATASIGIAMSTDSTSTVASLLRNADAAMYLSKSRGKGRVEFFEATMHEEALERLDLRADLQDALDDDQLVLHYQPIFDLRTGRVTLVEALLRWQHPTRGLVEPERFVPLAEENGLIVPIGDWVLKEACRQAAQWQRIKGCDEIGVTVNLSMRQLQDSQLVNTLTRSLQDSGLDASHLVLEITESMLALDAERSAGILGQLKTIGVKLAIDDFGTGYSSLSYLRSFSVDSIKIDRSFISELHRSSTSTALIDAIVNLSQALGAYTVAEGIEHDDQADLLRKLGCDCGQGFYYCRPLTGPAITTLFKDHVADEQEPLEAWRRSSEAVQHRLYDVEVRRGMDEIREVAAEITMLNHELEVPVMGTWPWLEKWGEAFGSWSPLMIGVRSADSSELSACALLAFKERAEGTAIVALGHGSSLLTALQARDSGAAKALGHGIVTTLGEFPGAWSLELEQIHDMDPTMLYLADELEHVQVLHELRIPRVVFSSAHTVDDVLSKSMRKQLRRARRRIEEQGLELSISFDRGAAISASLIDEVEEVHLSRDRDARRTSDLDRPAEREFWRGVVENRHDWDVEIASLRIDGELAAYAVALLDGDTYRIYDGRMSTTFEDYSPGRLVEAAALSRAITDPQFVVLDWMSGVAAEKLLTTNIAEGRARLVATSGSGYLSSVKRHRTRASELVGSDR